VVESHKNRSENLDDENDLLDAFVACGGNADKSGCVQVRIRLPTSACRVPPFSSLLPEHHFQKDTMIHIIKYDFGLTINIEELINKIDTDGSGEIEYDEFELLLGK